MMGMELEAQLKTQPKMARRISPHEWDIHWPLIQEALDRIPQFWADYWTKEFIYNAVVLERWQAWGFGKDDEKMNVVVLTQICDFPANRFLQVPLAFGNSLDDCIPLIESTLERFMIATECGICEIIGRPGWEKKFPRFRRYGVVLKARPRMGVH